MVVVESVVVLSFLTMMRHFKNKKGKFYVYDNLCFLWCIYSFKLRFDCSAGCIDGSGVYGYQRNEMALLSYGIATASALMFNYLPFKEEFIVGTIMLSGLAFKMNKPLVGVQCAFVALDLRFALALQSSLEGRSIIPLNSKGN